MERVRTIEEKAHCLSKLVNSIGNPEDEVLWAEYAANGRSGVVSYIEKQLTELLDDILERRVSIDHFKVEDAEVLCRVFECDKIDQELCSTLSHHIYGADERSRYFC
jgi:hypothetical protein